jgi:hypothetical protein
MSALRMRGQDVRGRTEERYEGEVIGDCFWAAITHNRSILGRSV